MRDEVKIVLGPSERSSKESFKRVTLHDEAVRKRDVMLLLALQNQHKKRLQNSAKNSPLPPSGSTE